MVLGHAILWFFRLEVHIEPQHKGCKQCRDLCPRMKLASTPFAAMAKRDNLTVHLHLVEDLWVCVAVRTEAAGVGEVLFILVNCISIEEDGGTPRNFVAFELHVHISLPEGELCWNV